VEDSVKMPILEALYLKYRLPDLCPPLNKSGKYYLFSCLIGQFPTGDGLFERPALAYFSRSVAKPDVRESL
jgi:hypothetical protein